MLRVAGSVLLVLWGLLNAAGGVLGARSHPAPGIGALFAAVGLLIAAGGVGFWKQRTWAIPVSLAGLLGLSAVAALSSYLLHGASGMRLSHHVTRLLISCIAFLMALLGSRSRRSKQVE